MIAIRLAEQRLLPDWLVRIGIRRLLSERLKQQRGYATSEPDRARAFAEELKTSPIAIETDAANRQHYEVPAKFFELALGPRLKYSCGLWDAPHTTLAESEAAMLKLTCERAQLADGMEVLELGCGWGSLCLWIAEHYSSSRVLAVSNSASQREFIEAGCRERGITNLEIVTANVAEFQTERRFDRVVSVEMFEHVRNYEQLLHQIAGWLKPDGKLFVHIFCHRDMPYAFEVDGANDWMARHFFSGGIMPSRELFQQFSSDLRVTKQWTVHGEHYARTCEAWLAKLDAQSELARAALAEAVGPDHADLHMQRWRMFFMACAELFHFRGGEEWFVEHYLFDRRV